jgi:peptidoglycan-associated lipoprotein
MKKTKILSIISLAILCIFVGCKKNTTMPVEKVESPSVSTPAQTWDDHDTTSFAEVDLESEMAGKIKENLQVLYFEYNQSDLTSESLQKLQTAASFLKEQSQIRIRLDGHADERGTTEYNMALGEKRATTVRDVLTRYGIDIKRIEATSFGREKPANPDCDGNDACHSLNRRVEYTIIKK